MSESPQNNGDPIAPSSPSRSKPQRPLQFGFFGLFAIVTVVAIVAGALHNAMQVFRRAPLLTICLLGIWLMVVAVERGASAYLGGIILAFGAVGLLATCLLWADVVVRQTVK